MPLDIVVYARIAYLLALPIGVIFPKAFLCLLFIATVPAVIVFTILTGWRIVA